MITLERMGKVIAQLKLTNHRDLIAKSLKALRGKVHQARVEALVDSGATRLYLKPSVIRALGLRKSGTVVSRTTNGTRKRNVYEPVRLELMGRNGIFEVVAVDEEVPNLLGQIPLEHLDLVIDPKARKLRPNPDHGNRQMSEEY
jgi:predicted aspartyl protease